MHPSGGAFFGGGDPRKWEGGTVRDREGEETNVRVNYRGRCCGSRGSVPLGLPEKGTECL